MKETVGVGVNVSLRAGVGVLEAVGVAVPVAVAVTVGVSVGGPTGVGVDVGVGDATGVAVGVGSGVGVGPGGGNWAPARLLRLNASNNPIPHPKLFRRALRISFLIPTYSRNLRRACKRSVSIFKARLLNVRKLHPRTSWRIIAQR